MVDEAEKSEVFSKNYRTHNKNCNFGHMMNYKTK